MRLALLCRSCSSLPAPRRNLSAKLLSELRQGGYVLFLRHASTDFSQNDSRMTSFEDCATQRNLTDKGRAEARALGEHVRRLKIPIGEVLASPFCRTMETARLAFGKARATNEVRGGPLSADDPKRYEPLRKLLGTQARRGHQHRRCRATATRSAPWPARLTSPKARSRWCARKAASGSAWSLGFV